MENELERRRRDRVRVRGGRRHTQGAFVPVPVGLSFIESLEVLGSHESHSAAQARTPPRLAEPRRVRARSRSRQRRRDSRRGSRRASARSVSRGRPSVRSVSPSTRPASEPPVITTQLYRLITGIVDLKVKKFADEMRKQKEQEIERKRCRDAFIDTKLVGLSSYNDDRMAEIDELRSHLGFGKGRNPATVNKGAGKGKGETGHMTPYTRGCSNIITALHRGNADPHYEGHYIYSFHDGDVFCSSRHCIQKQYPNEEGRQWIKGYNHLISAVHREQNLCATINVDEAWYG